MRNLWADIARVFGTLVTAHVHTCTITLLFHPSGALHIAGRNSASYFTQNLAAAMAPGGSRSSSRASAGSTVVAGETELSAVIRKQCFIALPGDDL